MNSRGLINNSESGKYRQYHGGSHPPSPVPLPEGQGTFRSQNPARRNGGHSLSQNLARMEGDIPEPEPCQEAAAMPTSQMRRLRLSKGQ